jgi:hypothetical protein
MPSTLRLPCKLTEADRLVIQADLSAALKANEEVKAEKKSATKSYNEAIREHDETIHGLNENLLAGVIYREVEVSVETDMDSGKQKTIRLDTGEEVITKDIDPDERQIHFDAKFAEARAKEAAAGTSEEQTFAETPEEAEQLREQRLADEQRERAQEERLTLWLKDAQRKMIVLPVLDAKDGEDGLKASAAGLFGGAPISATGITEQEARDTLSEVLISMWKQAEEQAERERQERILAKLGELLATVTFERLVDESGAPAGVRAKADSGGVTMEAEGDGHEAAAAALRAKLVEVLTENEEEVARLAAEQAHDSARDGLKSGGLKVPAGHKPKRAKKVRVENEAGEDLAPTEEEKPAGDEGDGLAF